MTKHEKRNIKYESVRRLGNLNPDCFDYKLAQLSMIKLFEREENYHGLIENFSSKIKDKINYGQFSEKQTDIFEATIDTYNQLLKEKEFYEDHYGTLESSGIDLTGLSKKLILPEENRTNLENNKKSITNIMESMN